MISRHHDQCPEIGKQWHPKGTGYRFYVLLRESIFKEHGRLCQSRGSHVCDNTRSFSTILLGAGSPAVMIPNRLQDEIVGGIGGNFEESHSAIINGIQSDFRMLK